jgi:urease accessory protein
MLTARSSQPPGAFDPEGAETITLDREGRHRRRITLTGDGGTSFLLDLPEATALVDGTGLVLEDGRTLVVRSAPEPLLEVTAASAHELLRLAWHIGNRHLPAMIQKDRILIRRDHVIADMIRGLGGTAAEVDAPFEPEGGAYGQGGDGGHGHHH